MPQIQPNPEFDAFYEQHQGMPFPQMMDLWAQTHPKIGGSLGGTPNYGINEPLPPIKGPAQAKPPSFVDMLRK
jgi:hypothetical protein